MSCVRACLALMLLLQMPLICSAQETNPLENSLVGRWETSARLIDKDIPIEMEFTKDKKMLLRIGTTREEGSYKIVDEKTVEVAVGTDLLKKKYKLTAKVEGKTLTIKDKNGRVDKFTRVTEK